MKAAALWELGDLGSPELNAEKHFLQFPISGTAFVCHTHSSFSGPKLLSQLDRKFAT